MAHLSICLLGPFSVHLDDRPVTAFVSDKVRALLAYLVTESDRAHRRETLAGLLWPEVPEASARNSLRTALVNLRTAIGDRQADPPFLHISRTTIQFNGEGDVWCDVTAFRRLVTPPSNPLHEEQVVESLAEAIELYRGSLLEGFSLADSVAFEDWALIKREQFQRQVLEALYRVAAFREQRLDHERALPFAWWQVALDPWREDAQRQLMRLLASSGQRAAALAQYESLRCLLADELGVEPTAQTRALYEHIRTATEAIALSSGTVSPDAAAIPQNLPARTSPFIGRQRELSELAAQITDPDTRLVTVVGPGGMGKTRLALEAARRQVTSLPASQADRVRFPAGAWLVELAPVGDPCGVPLAVASALGAQPLPGRELTDVIVDSLQTRELLLVLDNCEHLLEGVAPLVSHLIARCSQLTVLATSREALRIPGEHIVDVPPMAVSLPGSGSDLGEADAEGILSLDAVQLFATRAAAVRPGFAVDEGNAVQVAYICRRLDGMPLAIELAAARLRALSLQDVAVRLDDRFALLDRGSRVAEPRQQTLRNTVAWSYELLDQRERTLFDRLSVFRGGYALRAAEGVCAGGVVEEDAVLDLLAGLVDKSMVATRFTGVAGETRYELLETMRQYAAERLAERGETEAVSARHAWCFVDLAEELEPQVHAWDDWVTPIRRLHAEVDNLATAMRWSLARDQPEIALRISGALREWFWTHPYGQQFHNWARAALEADTSVAPQVRAKALNTVSMWAWGKGNADLGRELAGEAVRLARQAQDHRVLLRALYELGRHVLDAGQYERAAALFEESRDMSFECGHHIGAIEASTWLAFMQEPQERRARLAGLLPQAPYTWQAYIHQVLGGTCVALGDLAAAERHLAQAYQRWGEAEILPTQSIALFALGDIAVLRGNDERAHSLLQQAVDLGRRCGQIANVLAATNILGRQAWRRGDLDTAWQRGREALAVAHERGNLHDVLDVMCWLVYVACAQGDYQRAEELGRASLEGYAEHEGLKRSEATMALARVALFRGDAARAVELYRASLAGVWPAEWTSALCALEGLGWAWAEEGQHDQATRLLATATCQRETSGACLPPIDRPWQARVIAALRRALGETAFVAAWAEGEALTLEEAILDAIAGR